LIGKPQFIVVKSFFFLLLSPKGGREKDSERLKMRCRVLETQQNNRGERSRAREEEGEKKRRFHGATTTRESNKSPKTSLF
jgi:hypothetical protein